MSGRARDLVIAAFIALAVCQPAPTQTPGIQTEPQQRDIVVDVRSDRSIVWDGKLVTDAEMDSILADMDASGSKQDIHVRGDPNASYEAIHRVMSRLQKSGRAKLGIIGGSSP